MANKCEYCGRFFDNSGYYPYCCQSCYEKSGAAEQDRKAKAGGDSILAIIIVGLLLIIPGMQYLVMIGLGKLNGFLLGLISLVLAFALPIITWKINKVFGVIFTIAYFLFGFLIYFGVIPVPGVMPRWLF